MRTATTIALALLALAARAGAQDPVKVDPAHYKVAFENERLRVLKAMPAGKGVMHSHPANFVVFLTDATIKMNLADGTSQQMEPKANTAVFDPGSTHAPDATGQGAVAILVELKAPAAKQPASVTAGPMAAARPHETSTTLLSNERGDVVKLAFEAGFAEAPGSTHDWDTIVIPISEPRTEITIDGKAQKLARGEPLLIPRGVPHQAKATGPGEVIVVRVR